MNTRSISVCAVAATFALPLAISTSYAVTTSLPSVSVSSVTATSPVVRLTEGIDILATVTPKYDSDSGPTTTTVNNNCRSNNNYCGTGNNSVTDQTVATTTTVKVVGNILSVSAVDPYSSQSLTLNAAVYSGDLPNPTTAGQNAADGETTVTVTANVSEDVTTTVSTITTNKSCTSSKGVTTCITVSTSNDTSTKTITKTASGNGTGNYVLDINPPILTLKPDQSQPTVSQGENKNIHNVIVAGSAGTSYTLTDTATGPGGYTSSADGSGIFASSNDGIAPDEHDLVSVHIACDAPVGEYSAAAVAHTVDLGDKDFDPITSVHYVDNKGNDIGEATDTFTVLPGISLEDQTTVVSELPPSGDYAPMSCFTSTQSGRKVSTFPGSLHITATVNTTGPCAGFGTISGTVITLTLPEGFKFDTTGNSPAAHVFVGPAASGFDYHNPSTFQEVTSLIPKPSASGQTVTVDLSNLNLNQGPGVIPSSDTIYVRAHAVFSGSAPAADGTPYVFTTSTGSTLPGIGSTTNSSSQTVTASSACVNGGN
jgi:hypothetical protein